MYAASLSGQYKSLGSACGTLSRKEETSVSLPLYQHGCTRFAETCRNTLLAARVSIHISFLMYTRMLHNGADSTVAHSSSKHTATCCFVRFVQPFIQIYSKIRYFWKLRRFIVYSREKAWTNSPPNNFPLPNRNLFFFFFNRLWLKFDLDLM